MERQGKEKPGEEETMGETHIEATVEKVIYRNNEDGFSVVSFRDKKDNAFFKGTCSLPVALQGGQSVQILEGTWVGSKYGEQLKISNLRICDPVTSEGIVAYLATGVIRGVGPVLARRIVERFGEETLAILDREPTRLVEVKGVGAESVESIIGSWSEQRKLASMIMDLCVIGLSLAYANKAYRHFGQNAAAIVRDNPYRLTEVYGIGFVKADEIGKKIGIDDDDPFRVCSGIGYVLEQATGSGHCYLPYDEIVRTSGEVLHVGEGVVEKGIEDMAARDKLFMDRMKRCYLPHIHEAEKLVERKFVRMAFTSRNIPGELQSVLRQHEYLTAEQAAAVENALSYELSVLTGLPGTGKTETTRAIVRVLEATGQSYALCAPTGKAAKRLSEATGRDAKTIHRLLDFSPEEGFRRNAENPLDVEYVVVDEVSMVDIVLMARLVEAIEAGTSVVLVGDADQLPSVGPGNLLRDIIRARVCATTRLTEIHRQALESDIIKVSHLINSGRKPIFNGREKEVLFILEEDVLRIRERLVDVIRESPFGQRDIQVLTPMRKTPIGVVELNRLLQQELNGGNGEASLQGYRVGDRVIHLVNNYKKNVFNGEVGHVTGLDLVEGQLSVDYGDKLITYEDHEADEMELAYALTIHKSQGSQFPCVVMPLHTAHFVMLKRELLYTGVTRAEKMVIFVGTERALAIAVRADQESRRYTGLFS